MRRAALAALVAFAVACEAVGLPPSARSLPPATSAGCGQQITGDFTLANDLSCPGDGLVVAADGVIVDLGGRTITGPGKGQRNWPQPNLDSVGVKVQGRARVTVRNGTISAFSTSVLLDGAAEVIVEGIRADRSYYGVYLNNSTRSAIRRSTITLNTYGVHLQRSNENEIVENELVRQEYSSPGGYGIYMFASRANRIVGNNIASNLNWGIWFSDARDNVIFRNNVTGNSPQVSANREGNRWYDAERREGNHWGDYGGLDRNGDGIGDSPYQIGGPGGEVDAYPFVERDGWKSRRSETIDTYTPPPPKPARDVRLVALTDAGVVMSSPNAAAAEGAAVRASSIAIAPDDRTLYTLSGSILSVMDAVTGTERGRFAVDLGGLLVAGRDGRSAIVVGPDGAMRVDTARPDRRRFTYDHEPRDAAASWKHNIVFVSTARGVDVLYVGQRGSVPYTIPLDGPGGAMAMNRSGTRLYAVAVGQGLVDAIDTEQYAVVDALRLPWEAVALAVSPDERTLYVAAREGVLAVDLVSRGVRGMASFAGTPVDIGVSPNGDQLYVALTGAERGIAVVGTTELRMERLVRTEGTPTRLLVASY